MLKKTIMNVYNAALSLGAFYLGGTMMSGKGIFAAFPPEWVGDLPFDSWMAMAIVGMIVFGLGNAVVAIRGFIRYDRQIFFSTLFMGALLFIATIGATLYVGEWYLPSVQLLIASVVQLALGLGAFMLHFLRPESAGVTD